MRHTSLVLVAALLVPHVARGQKPDTPQQTPAQFLASLNPHSGTVTLKNGLAVLNVPENFRYIDGAESRRLLVQGWGNPPGSADHVLGMMFPAGMNPLDDSAYAVVVSFDEDGYVDDDDAESLDYAKLLRDMQRDAASENDSRREHGYPTVRLVGWATPPHYNRESHKLYWAKELAFNGATDHTLNYNVRLLGRRGVLVLNAVAPMTALAGVERDMQTMLTFVEFGEGHRYTDFVSGDKTAAYGIAGLVAGAVAAKAGFFKLLWLGILAAKKFIILGIVAVGAFLRKHFGKKDAPPAKSPAA